jgi:glycogen operon protein
LVLDSLRYWVEEMHVDGFRFDLAPTLAREPDEFQPFGRLFEMIRQDPTLQDVKFIAEPWDLGPGGWQLGGFPVGWSEWNDRFRDVTRRFWRGDEGQLPELASRLSGSSDYFAPRRSPQASINFVASHDGMTLRDLVTYSERHNEANGEQNRDGGHDESHNWGTEGPTASRRIRKLRERTRRNLFATLVLSQGVPMLSHGDELGRTQRGNNNAYCQDNELTWIDWEPADEDRRFLDFARALLALRQRNAVWRRRRFFEGVAIGPGLPDDLHWLRSDATPMTAADWSDPQRRTLALWIAAEAADRFDERGRPQAAETVLLLLNGDRRMHAFQLPVVAGAGAWHERVNTACDDGERCFGADTRVRVAPHGLVVLGWQEPS